MEIHEITGLQSGFEYEEILNRFSEEQLLKYAQKQKRLAAKITKNWNKELKKEWILRNYLSLKMILSSTLLLNSADFAIERNLRVVEPYLLYYSLLNTSRALLYTDPSENWKNGELITLSHSGIITQVSESVTKISSEDGNNLKTFLKNAKKLRELFSYRFPAEGIPKTTKIGFNDTLAVCRLLVEIAQFNSELLQVSGEKNIKETIQIAKHDLNIGYIYKGIDKDSIEVLFDREDSYRLGYFVRKQLDITNLSWVAREGLVDDFFSAWSLNEDDESDDYFNPDQNWNLLL